jgi:hypothetical protein
VGGECAGERGTVVTGWGLIGGGVKIGKSVDVRGQKDYLGGRTMDCRTGEGENVKKVRIGIKE